METPPDEEREVCLVTSAQSKKSVIPLHRYSSFSRLQHVTAWILRFVSNCRAGRGGPIVTSCLTVSELAAAQRYWLTFSQADCFPSKITLLKANCCLPVNSSLVPLHPFLDSEGVLRVGGREGNYILSFAKVHPVILHGQHLDVYCMQDQPCCQPHLDIGTTSFSFARQ